ncbi:MAG: hypothetical protein ACR2NX_04695 [Chthoniobacterales bacterium]
MKKDLGLSLDHAKCAHRTTDKAVAIDTSVTMPNKQSRPSPSHPQPKRQPTQKQIPTKRKKVQQPTQQIKDVVSALKELEREAKIGPKLKAVRKCRQALEALIRTEWERDIQTRHGQSAAITYEKELDGLLVQIGQLEACVKENEEAEHELLPESAKINNWLGVFKRAPRR